MEGVWWEWYGVGWGVFGNMLCMVRIPDRQITVAGGAIGHGWPAGVLVHESHPVPGAHVAGPIGPSCPCKPVSTGRTVAALQSAEAG